LREYFASKKDFLTEEEEEFRRLKEEEAIKDGIVREESASSFGETRLMVSECAVSYPLLLNRERIRRYPR
jgi:hypothetical protein